MSKSTVRNIFIFILIFLPLQYIAVGIVGFYHSEPWPAFVFPGFKNVYDTEGQYQIRDTRFELYNQQNEKLTSVSPHQIFEGIPRSQMGGFLRSRFHNRNTIQSFSDLAKDYLRKKSTLLVKEDVTSMNVKFRIEYIRPANRGVEMDSTVCQLIGKINFSD